MNTSQRILAGGALCLTCLFTAQAQQTQERTTETRPAYDNTDNRSSYANSGAFGPEAGDWELILGGGGSSNTDFDNSLGGLNFSFGHFMSESFEISLRQSINYSNGPGGGADYNGSTFVAFDQHFGADRLRPFVGLNFGRLYGDNTNNTWAAGIEAGLKFYVQPKAFVFLLANYAWAFEKSNKLTDNFSDGAVLWNVGVGLNF